MKVIHKNGEKLIVFQRTMNSCSSDSKVNEIIVVFVLLLVCQAIFFSYSPVKRKIYLLVTLEVKVKNRKQMATTV